MGSIGMVLLAVWFLLYGLFAFIPQSGIPFSTILAVWAIVVGILLLVGR